MLEFGFTKVTINSNTLVDLPTDMHPDTFGEEQKKAKLFVVPTRWRETWNQSAKGQQSEAPAGLAQPGQADGQQPAALAQPVTS